MSKVKYMGTADVRLLEKGEDFGGRLGEPLTADLVFSRENNWVVDTDDAGLSSEALELLLEEPDFKDVGELKRIPDNEHQKLFLARPTAAKSEPADAVLTTAESVSDSPSGDAGTTVGGSTGGKSGGKTGGSTRTS